MPIPTQNEFLLLFLEILSDGQPHTRGQMLDQAREEVRDQLAYVGLSRARHHVIVIGALPAPGTAEA